MRPIGSDKGPILLESTLRDAKMHAKTSLKLGWCVLFSGLRGFKRQGTPPLALGTFLDLGDLKKKTYLSAKAVKGLRRAPPW